MGAQTALETGGLLRVAIEGRVTAAAIGDFRRALEAALDAGEPFVVLFDRRAMTAPTAEGRAALRRWSAELLPRLHPACVAWADVYDARRAAALERAAAGDHAHEEHPSAYPQRTFAALPDAERWLHAHLTLTEILR